ncbi:MAG TPA: hypothetical protein VFX49_16305 [Chloroflexota bacterium]|nr:hypothetical protein [Chloroflexota bacterium]
MPADTPELPDQPPVQTARSMRAWRIVARRAGERGDLVYDVYQGPQRRAWGLKDRETAERWRRRLAPPGDPVEDAPEPAPDEDASGMAPRRVWWNDA